MFWWSCFRSFKSGWYLTLELVGKGIESLMVNFISIHNHRSFCKCYRRLWSWFYKAQTSTKAKNTSNKANITISQLIGQNIMKRTKDNTTRNYFCKARESPVGVYLGMMVYAKTWKKGIVDKLYELGISIPYSRVMELSTCLGNKVLQHYQ